MRFHFQARPGTLAIESLVNDLLSPYGATHDGVRQALETFEVWTFTGPADVCRAPHGAENPGADVFLTCEDTAFAGAWRNEGDDREPRFASE